MGHRLAALIVVLAITATGAFFAFARPTYERETLGSPPDHGLPYTEATYSASDARRVFTAEGADLKRGPRIPAITSFFSRDEILAVDVFGDRESVERIGFYNYTMVDGKYVPFPTSCSPGATSAVRWHENIRAVVSCTNAHGASAKWFRRVERAFARL